MKQLRIINITQRYWF